VSGVVNDNTAVALQYGKERQAGAKDGETVLFVDVGSSFTSASIATYTSLRDGTPQVTVKAVTWDESLGGRHFDARLADHLADAFDKKTGFKIRENLKSFNKLLGAASKAKMQLSANEVTVVSIGSLMNDVDFTLKVERKELDDLCKDLYAKIAGPVKAVLEKTGLKVADLDFAVPFGGGWRSPGLQAVLKEELGIEKLNTIINSDEAAAFGATFIHGNSSGLLRVRPINLLDLTTPPKAEEFAAPMSQDAVKTAAKRHTGMVTAEEERKKKEAAKSALEAWIYSIREKVNEDDDEGDNRMEKLATEDEIAKVKSVLEAGEEWVYDEGEKADLAGFAAKRADIEKTVSPIVSRYEEFLARPAAIKQFKLRVERAKGNAKDWATQRPQIPAEERAKLQTMAEEAEKWFEAGEAKLKGDGLKSTPPFTAAELKQRGDALKEKEEVLLLIKPKTNSEL